MSSREERMRRINHGLTASEAFAELKDKPLRDLSLGHDQGPTVERALEAFEMAIDAESRAQVTRRHLAVVQAERVRLEKRLSRIKRHCKDNRVRLMGDVERLSSDCRRLASEKAELLKQIATLQESSLAKQISDLQLIMHEKNEAVRKERVRADVAQKSQRDAEAEFRQLVRRNRHLERVMRKRGISRQPVATEADENRAAA